MDNKTQYVSAVTVGPSCFIDGRKRRKQRFTLFNAALDMISSSPNEKPSKNIKPVKRNDDKINSNNNDNGKNTEGWKKFVGSMRPLHMQASQSPSSSPRHSENSDSAISCPLSTSKSSNSSTSGYLTPQNNLQDFENVGTLSTNASRNSLQEFASIGSSGTMSPSSPNDLQEVEGTLRHSTASSNNLQEVSNTAGTTSTSVLPDLVQEESNTGTMSTSVLANNIQEVSNTAGTRSTSVSPDIVQEKSNTGSMSTSVSANNLDDLARAGSMRKHSISSGNLRGLGRKGKMGSSKSTSNLPDLSSGKIRQYKSALNLHDLDMNEEIEAEEDTDDKLLENCAADTMIDVKADQFIKSFYQQMKSQHKRKVRGRSN